MATTAVPYSSVLTLMATTGLNFVAGDAVVVLATSAYTPSQTGHAFLSDITNEVTDLSYDRVLMTSKAQTYSAGKLTLSAVDTTFPALTATGVRYAIFAMLEVTDSVSPLIGYWDLGVNQNSSVNDFKLIYNVNGFLTIEL